MRRVAIALLGLMMAFWVAMMGVYMAALSPTRLACAAAIVGLPGLILLFATRPQAVHR